MNDLVRQPADRWAWTLWKNTLRNGPWSTVVVCWGGTRQAPCLSPERVCLVVRYDQLPCIGKKARRLSG
jgi:hypothetical protein